MTQKYTENVLKELKDIISSDLELASEYNSIVDSLCKLGKMVEKRTQPKGLLATPVEIRKKKPTYRESTTTSRTVRTFMLPDGKTASIRTKFGSDIYSFIFENGPVTFDEIQKGLNIAANNIYRARSFISIGTGKYFKTVKKKTDNSRVGYEVDKDGVTEIYNGF